MDEKETLKLMGAPPGYVGYEDQEPALQPKKETTLDKKGRLTKAFGGKPDLGTDREEELRKAIIEAVRNPSYALKYAPEKEKYGYASEEELRKAVIAAVRNPSTVQAAFDDDIRALRDKREIVRAAIKAATPKP